jgi:hypothetical protein
MNDHIGRAVSSPVTLGAGKIVDAQAERPRPGDRKEALLFEKRSKNFCLFGVGVGKRHVK